MTPKEIVKILPYEHPFLFVDEIEKIDNNGVTGTYTYDPDLDFYKGHFKNNPITPGVILTETMAQIGVVSLGIHLFSQTDNLIEDMQIALTSSQIDFFKPVFPSEKVTVVSEKEYFRFNKLKCKVEMFNFAGELVCRGKIAGMIASKKA